MENNQLEDRNSNKEYIIKMNCMDIDETASETFFFLCP
jgi:hypothetical protein